MSHNQNIESMLATVRQVWESAQRVLDNLKDGERVQAKVLSETVAKDMSCEPKDIMVFVEYFMRHTDGGYIARGKNGGLVKGTKPVKAADPSPVQ